MIVVQKRRQRRANLPRPQETVQSKVNGPVPAELVFGLVAPVGTDLDSFYEEFRGALAAQNYDVQLIRVSNFLSPRRQRSDIREYGRLRAAMDAGSERRKKFGSDMLALTTISYIHSQRSVDDDEGAVPEPERRAWIVRSLKHPDEVEVLRRVYGAGFFLVGVASTLDERLEYLTKRHRMTEAEATSLIERDRREEMREEGQRTDDTFHLSDVFVRPRDTEGHRSVKRFVELVLGHPFHTPTRDEQAMFFAFTSALRSADLSRQVGATVVSEHGDIVSVGCNDVPAPGGGLYWPDDPNDHRDFQLQIDSNAGRRNEIVDQLYNKLKVHLDEGFEKQRFREAVLAAGIGDISEFGRAVHAEMEALISCARIGISPRGGTLYSTTMPCHNCAKHIVAAGIRRVVYVEPYPRSQAFTLHDDAIADGAKADYSNRVQVSPFVGVGPRKYFDLFSVNWSTGRRIKRKDSDTGKIVKWTGDTAEPRIPLTPLGYIEREKVAVLEESERRDSA